MSLYNPKRAVRLGRQTIAQWKERKALDQRAQAVTIRSKALGISKRFYIYAPPGAKKQRDPLPVIYLFRGHEREWINPQQDDSRQGRTVIDVYEELLQAGSVGPMVLVFPGVCSDDSSVPGLLVNFKAPTVQPVAGLGSGRFEDYFLQELVPYVDANYRTRIAGKRPARGVDGFSLGGFQAVKIASQHPALFASVGAYDGLYFWDDPNDPQRVNPNDGTFQNPMFDPAFGPAEQRDLVYAAAHNPLNLVRNGAAEVLGELRWMIEYGPREGEPNQSNFYRGDRLCALLASKGIVNDGRGELKTTNHNWHCADEHMRYTLPLHWQAFQQL
ncbi:MAG TPA: alpha/beta hydrolase-fold protein [Herpetosiphonaceae bacterium]